MYFSRKYICKNDNRSAFSDLQNSLVVECKNIFGLKIEMKKIILGASCSNGKQNKYATLLIVVEKEGV
jgi:hypothetical protein